MARKRRNYSNAVVWGIGAVALITGVASFSAGVKSARVDSSSQVAAGIEADMQCMGDYDPTCQYPQINPKTKKKCLIGKPCKDVTSGHETTGTCQAKDKCKGEQTGGMMPMLPMLPMMMPMMSMPSMPPPEQPCVPAPTTGTTSTSTAESTKREGFGALPCPSEQLSSLSQYIFGNTSETDSSATSKEGSTWDDLFNSLLGDRDSESEDSDASSSDTTETSNPGGTPASGFFSGLVHGVQTIIKLTGIQSSEVYNNASNDPSETSATTSGGFFTTGSTFVSPDISATPSQPSALTTIQQVLTTLGQALQNFLASLTK